MLCRLYNRVADELDRHADVALVDAESYIANPINAYLFVKKFTTEWPDTMALLESTSNVDSKSLMRMVFLSEPKVLCCKSFYMPRFFLLKPFRKPEFTD